MTAPSEGDTFQPGDLLNNTYRIETLLGKGGLSEVYRARSDISGRVVAIKVLKSEFSDNDDYLSLMTREEEVRDIRHDAIVRYSENHRLPNGQVYLVMDYVDGPDLEAKLKGGGMSAEDLLAVARQVSAGLAACHARNIVHRDLSPDNIILRSGNPEEAVIIDFGIAKDDNPGAGTIIGNEFAGKYSYAAPEQLDGRTDRRSDIYALGALLLATFRGKAPDIGNNPMEVVKRKGLPLDTDGVPEPLKSLLDRMTAPSPDQRFQTIEEVLSAIDSGVSAAPVSESGADDPLADILMPDDPAPAPAPAPEAKPEVELISPRSKKKSRKADRKAPAAKTEKSGGSKKGLMAVLAVVLLIGAGAGAYFGGLLGPRYPTADPFTFTAEVTADGTVRASGFVPSEETKGTIEEQMAALRGSAELELATGDIAETWGPGVSALIEQLMPLEEWRLVTSGNDVRITGLTLDRNTRDQMTARLNSQMPEGLRGNAEILLGPRLLAPTELRPIITGTEDCGPLRLIDPPAMGYGLGGSITIAGRFAAPETRTRLLTAMEGVIGDRSVNLMTETLNPSLCAVAGNLPNVSDGGLDIVFGWGDRPEQNVDGNYRVDENPTIDISLPAHITGGYLWVSIVDVSGKAYHLIPNRLRADASVATLRVGSNGPIRIRAAYGVDDPARGNGLAFLVDDTSVGMSQIIAIHAAEPFFDGLRPTEESVESFVEALKARMDQGALNVDAVVTRVLTTVR